MVLVSILVSDNSQHCSLFWPKYFSHMDDLYQEFPLLKQNRHNNSDHLLKKPHILPINRRSGGKLTAVWSANLHRTMCSCGNHITYRTHADTSINTLAHKHTHTKISDKQHACGSASVNFREISMHQIVRVVVREQTIYQPLQPAIKGKHRGQQHPVHFILINIL